MAPVDAGALLRQGLAAFEEASAALHDSDVPRFDRALRQLTDDLKRLAWSADVTASMTPGLRLATIALSAAARGLCARAAAAATSRRVPA